MKNLVIRALTGAVLLLVMISAILMPPYIFGIVFFALTILCLYEFYGLCYKVDQAKPISRWAMVGGGMLFLSVFFAELLQCPWIVPVLYVPFFTGTFVVELFRHNGNPILNVAMSLLGHIYVALPFSCLCMIESFGASGDYSIDGANWQGGYLVLAFFIAIWISDTGAYLVGRAIGRHKLYERVSPKKSWEGFWGGFVLAATIGFLFGRYFPNLPEINGHQLYDWQWMVFFALISVLGTLGDLVESLFKRYFKVKDSSNMLPGHGGFLDRFDSAIISAPFAYAILLLFFTK
ncbi:MAG: phosphatidate cytidylyltransferase [Paludibacteraceae bacterium]|nr:phosphatidate cytidylyltransferase [Paludibacteraceae bacterium]